MNDLFNQPRELYPEIVKHVPPMLSLEQIDDIKDHVQKKPASLRKNKPIHQSIDISLTDENYCEVWEKVGAIQLNHAKKHHKHKYGCKRTWETIPGWFAEKAVSLWPGLPWNPTVNNFIEYDVGNLQVRATQYDFGLMLTHPEDNGDDPVVFVTNDDILINRIRGWLFTSETKDYGKYWCKLERGRPCFGVPLWDLRQPETLLPLLEGNL